MNPIWSEPLSISGWHAYVARRADTLENLPFTRRMLGVDLDGSRRIEPAHVGCLVGPDGSRRMQKDRLDDHRDDQSASRITQSAEIATVSA